MKLGFASMTFSIFLAYMAIGEPLLVQGGQIFSQLLPRRDHNQDLHHPHPSSLSYSSSSSNPVPHLDWNSQTGQQLGSSRQGQPPSQFQPYDTFQLEQQQQQQQQQLQQQIGSSGPPCRSRDRVYLPDMQSFLIQSPLTYAEAVQACQACRSELVLVDGTNIDRFAEAFSSLGLYGDKKFWIKSWFGEAISTPNVCPAVQVDPLMGNRLTPIQENCNSRFYALCY
ncbi:hypothetical protein BGZ94_003145 [Podila epigama]|nr:hypothetical protein BGZ94_003145 [Podila epigama]